jgi:hypothetical protein
VTSSHKHSFGWHAPDHDHGPLLNAADAELGRTGAGHSATQAKIIDFELGNDVLVFEHAGKLDFHDVTTFRGNTIVLVGDDRIELVGVRPFELSKHDFLFDK